MEKNYYQILGIPNFSSEDVINQAFQEKKEKFFLLKSPSTKQAKAFDDVMDAYNLLLSPMDKEEFDRILNEKIFMGQAHKLDSNETINESSDGSSDGSSDENTPNTNKQKVTVGTQDSSISPFFLIVGGIIILFLSSYLYNVFTNDEAKNSNEDESEVVIEEVVAPVKNELIVGLNNISDLALYPDKRIFETTSIIHSPNGLLFPQTASVLGTLPMNGDGMNTVILQNPKNTAIFGRLILSLDSNQTAKVLRHFYIPPKETLYLFNISSGSLQFHILTLSDPVAYISPAFNFPIGLTSELTQVADWNYEESPSELF